MKKLSEGLIGAVSTFTMTSPSAGSLNSTSVRYVFVKSVTTAGYV